MFKQFQKKINKKSSFRNKPYHPEMREWSLCPKIRQNLESFLIQQQKVFEPSNCGEV